MSCPFNRDHLAAAADRDGWTSAAMFAAYCLRMKSLALKPWQIAPMDIDDADNADDGRGPVQAGFDGRYEAAALLKRMLAAGISRFDGDPEAALARKAANFD